MTGANNEQNKGDKDALTTSARMKFATPLPQPGPELCNGPSLAALVLESLYLFWGSSNCIGVALFLLGWQDLFWANSIFSGAVPFAPW